MKSHDIMENIITLERVTDRVFEVETKRGNARMAINAAGILSSMRAQAIDRENGTHYILVTTSCIKHDRVIEAAKQLNVGAACVISL